MAYIVMDAFVFCHSGERQSDHDISACSIAKILHKIRRDIIITFATLNYTFRGEHFNLMIPFLLSLFLIIAVCTHALNILQTTPMR